MGQDAIDGKIELERLGWSVFEQLVIGSTMVGYCLGEAGKLSCALCEHPEEDYIICEYLAEFSRKPFFYEFLARASRTLLFATIGFAALTFGYKAMNRYSQLKQLELEILRSQDKNYIEK